MLVPLFQSLFPQETHHMAGFYQELERCAPAVGKVLDLGCGKNTDLERLRTLDREVWGTDFQAHSELNHEQWFRLLGRGGAIPFSNETFDVVACRMVMEHVEDPAGFLKEIGRVLRPGGRFVGHSISGYHYVTWIRRAFDLFPHGFNQKVVRRLYGRAEEDTFPTYYRMNTPRMWGRASRSTGLRIERIQRYADPCYFGFHPTLMKMAVLADWSLEKLAAGAGRLYFTATLRKPGEGREDQRRK